MKFILIIALFVSVFFVGFGGYLNSISGRWTGSLTVVEESKTYPLVYVLKADGGKLTGTGLTPHLFEDVITNGKVSGNDFSFDLMVDGTAAKHTGKYFVAGDSVSLNIDFNGRTFHSTLTRSASPK